MKKMKSNMREMKREVVKIINEVLEIEVRTTK